MSCCVLTQGQQVLHHDDGCDACRCCADGDYGWGLLLRTLADVLQHDRRLQVADAALEMLFGLLTRYCHRWDAAAWRVLIQRVVRHMLALPPQLTAALLPGAVPRGAASAGAAAGSAGGSFQLHGLSSGSTTAAASFELGWCGCSAACPVVELVAPFLL